MVRIRTAGKMGRITTGNSRDKRLPWFAWQVRGKPVAGEVGNIPADDQFQFKALR